MKNTHYFLTLLPILLISSALMCDDEDVEINIARKEKEAVQLVNNAVVYLNKHTLKEACRSFTYDAQWRKGDLYISLFELIGKDALILLTNGDQTNRIWSNYAKIKSLSGATLFNELPTIGKQGGWSTYKKNQALKRTYNKTLTKNDRTYVIATGFCTESPENITRELVDAVASQFGHSSKEDIFSRVSNTIGQYIIGDIYLMIFDLKGNMLANGSNVAFIGQNQMERTDAKGKKYIKDMIDIAKNKQGEGWIEFEWYKTLKKAYVKRVSDPKTDEQYMIVGGYYPAIDETTVQEFLTRGIKHIKSAGLKAAATDFSNVAGEFIEGGTKLFIYDLNGIVIAEGEYPTFVGQNIITRRDGEGKPYIQQIISTAKKSEKGVLPVFDKNAYKATYFQLIDIPEGKYIVGTGFYPRSKSVIARYLVHKAMDYLNTYGIEFACSKFQEFDGEFSRGDMQIFVFDPEGTCYTNGIYWSMTWKNFIKETDENGQPYVQELIALATKGGGWLLYKTRNATRKIYVKAAEYKDAKGKISTYIIGTGYFL